MTGGTSHRMNSISLMKNGAFEPQGSPYLKSGFFKHAQKKSGEGRPPLREICQKNKKILPKFPFTNPSSNGKIFCKFLIFLLYGGYQRLLSFNQSCQVG